MVKLYAFANQHRLPRLSNNENTPAVLVTPDLAIEVLKIALKPFAQMTVGLERRTLNMLTVLKKMEKENLLQMKFTEGFEVEPQENSEAPLFIDQQVISMLVTQLKRSRRTILRYLEQCCESGWMLPTERKYKTQPREFKLLYPISEIEKKLGLFDINKMAEQYCSEFKKEAKKWLKPALTHLRKEGGSIRLDIIQHFI